MSTREYVKVTPDMEERVLAAYGRTGSYEKTSRETNLDERRVRYIVNDRPRLGRDTSSLKQRMLDLIIERGPYLDMMALHKDIPGPHGMHNLVHLLHSLHKAGLIDFRVDSKGKDADYLNIRARKTTLNVGETSDAVDTLEPAAPTPEADPYPVLTALLSRAEANAEDRAKASKYLTAAEALSAVDPVMAETLLAKAADVDGPIMSPVESEYLAYVEAHPRD